MSSGPVLLTRPLEDSQRIAELLQDEGISNLIWPLTSIVPVEADSPPPAGVDGLLVTSAHGIRAYADICTSRDLPVFCVGSHTAEIARSLGFNAVSNAGGDGVALARLATESPCCHFLYPRGREVSHDLASLLTPSGKKVTERVVYDALPFDGPPAPVADALQHGTLTAVTLWSRRSAALFSDWCEDREVNLLGTQLIAISDQVANAATGLRFGGKIVATEPGADAMIAAIRQAV